MTCSWKSTAARFALTRWRNCPPRWESSLVTAANETRWRTGHRECQSDSWGAVHAPNTLTSSVSSLSTAHNVNWPGGQCTAPPQSAQQPRAVVSVPTGFPTASLAGMLSCLPGKPAAAAAATVAKTERCEEGPSFGWSLPSPRVACSRVHRRPAAYRSVVRSNRCRALRCHRARAPATDCLTNSV